MLSDIIKNYKPVNEQESADKNVMLKFIDENKNYLLRENKIGHFTASAWIVNKQHNKLLFCYHNIYNSWSWVGGHADGEEDLSAVAIKEANEETGLKTERMKNLGLISLETLFVAGHEKHGEYVPCHVHFNLTYLIEADENDAVFIKPDENKGVQWFSFADALKASSEPWMVERIYKKLCDAVRKY